MRTQEPISLHLDLYRYWLAKRGRRAMPARSDLDAGDIPALLPYLMIVDKADGRLRWRLAGSIVVRYVGHEPTGSLLGSYGTLASAAAALAIYKRVFTTASPVFATGEFETGSDGVHDMSLLTLPLSGNGADVNMAISTLAVRFNSGFTPHPGWLKEVPAKVLYVADVNDAAQLEERCLGWECQCPW